MAARGSGTEARRRNILERGQERLKNIAYGGSGVSRSLNFGGEDPPARQSSLTPAASGLEPGGGADHEGAASRSKSWLAMQESPPASRKLSPDKTPPAGRRGNTPRPASPLAPAHSASLAPVSSPAPAYASDEEPVDSPMLSRSGASSGTAVAASPSTWSSGSPPPLPLPPSVNGTLAASPPPLQHSGRWAAYDSPGGENRTSEIQPATSTVTKRQRTASCAAAFQQALAASAPARTLLVAACAVLLYADAPLALAVGWQQHIGQLLPGVAQLQRVPPLAAIAALQLAVVLLAYLLRSPTPQQPAATQGGLVRAAGALVPQLQPVLGFLLPLYQHLWQDIAIYILTLAVCTEAGAPRYHPHWRQMHSLVGYHAALIPPQWRAAAGRWAL